MVGDVKTESETANDAGTVSEEQPSSGERDRANTAGGNRVNANQGVLSGFDPFAEIEAEQGHAQKAGNVSGPTEGHEGVDPKEEPSLPDLEADAGAPVPDVWQEQHARRHNATEHASTGRTVNAETQANYIYRATRMFARYRKDQRIDADQEISYEAFANWLLGLQPPFFKPSTWRLYKNSVVYFLEGVADPAAERAIALIRNAVQGVDPEEPNRQGAFAAAGKTTDQKAKSVPHRAYRDLIYYFREASRSSYAPIAADLIDATLVTGLRPSEWTATDIIRSEDESGDREILRVLSAKTTNNRGNVLIRSVDITNLDDAYRNAVHRMSEYGHEWAAKGVFDAKYRQLKVLLNKANRFIRVGNSRFVTFYSFRHQFIANCKANYSLIEVAALVGHSEIVTASEHYGRRKSAWGPDACPDLPEPVPEEVALIQERLNALERERTRHLYSGRSVQSLSASAPQRGAGRSA